VIARLLGYLVAMTLPWEWGRPWGDFGALMTAMDSVNLSGVTCHSAFASMCSLKRKCVYTADIFAGIREYLHILQIKKELENDLCKKPQCKVKGGTSEPSQDIGRNWLNLYDWVLTFNVKGTVAPST
jgi:hypothetical protein